MRLGRPTLPMLGLVPLFILAAGLLEAQEAGVDSSTVHPGIGKRPAAGLVAVTWLFPGGSDHDPPGAEGAARLLTGALVRSAGEQLHDQALLTARVERGWTAIQLLAPPGGWTEDRRRVETTLFELPVDPTMVERARAEILGQLTFAAGAPQTEFETLAMDFLSGFASGWDHPPVGLPGPIQELSVSDLEAVRASLLRPDRPVMTVTGALADSVHPSLPTPFQAPAGGATDRPLRPDERHVEREVTNVWIGWMFPAPPTADRTALSLLAHILDERLDPETPPPGRFTSTVQLLELPGRPALYIELAVEPRTLESWRRRVETALAALASDLLSPDSFGWYLRRFRSERALSDARLEDFGLRLAHDLFQGISTPLEERIGSLDPEALRSVASALGPPRIFILGPPEG